MKSSMRRLLAAVVVSALAGMVAPAQALTVVTGAFQCMDWGGTAGGAQAYVFACEYAAVIADDTPGATPDSGGFACVVVYGGNGYDFGCGPVADPLTLAPLVSAGTVDITVPSFVYGSGTLSASLTLQPDDSPPTLYSIDERARIASVGEEIGYCAFASLYGGSQGTASEDGNVTSTSVGGGAVAPGSLAFRYDALIADVSHWFYC